MRVRAAVLEEFGQPLAIQEVELEEPRAGEALVRLVACGVCHTDLYTASGADPSGYAPAVLAGCGRQRGRWCASAVRRRWCASAVCGFEQPADLLVRHLGEVGVVPAEAGVAVVDRPCARPTGRRMAVPL